MNNTNLKKGSRKNLKGGFRYTIEATYEDLCEILGDHQGPSLDGKVRAQWIVETPEGTASVYDYKNRTPIRELTEWHIGGDLSGAKYLQQTIEQYQNDLKLQVTFDTKMRDAEAYIGEIQAKLAQIENEIQAGGDITWGLIADLNRTNEQLKWIIAEQY